MNKALLAAAALLLSACGGARTNAALEAMRLHQPEGGTVSYASRSSGGLPFLGDGRTVTFRDVRLGGDDGDAFTAATMTLNGLGLDAAGRPQFSALSFTGLSPRGLEEGLEFTIASATLRNPNAEAAAFVTALFRGEEPVAGAAFDAWSFDALTVKGVQFTAKPPPESGESGLITLTLDEAAVSSLKGAVAQAASIAGLKGSFDVPATAGLAGAPVKGSFNWDRIDFSGVRGDVFAAISELGLSPQSFASAEFSARMMASVTSPIDPGYDGLRATPFTFDVSGMKLATSAIETRVERDADGVAVRASSPRFTATLSTDPEAGQLGQALSMGLGMLGYQSIELYAQSEAAYSPETDEMRVAQWELGAKDAFSFSLKGGFLGAKQALAGLYAVDPTGEPNLAAFASLGIKDVEITLTDASLTNRLLNLAPMMGAGDAAEVREMIVAQLAELAPMLDLLGVDPTVSAELINAASAFVRQPGTLSLRLSPAEPLKLGEIGREPTLTREALGLSAVHRPN